MASRGRVIRTVDAVMVRGRSGESRPSKTGDAGGDVLVSSAVGREGEGEDAMLAKISVAVLRPLAICCQR